MGMQGTAPITVVETPGYLADARRILTEAERDAVVDTVAENPECGVILQGTGGVRKVRVPAKGHGKSGGARVVYLSTMPPCRSFCWPCSPRTKRRT